MCEEPRIYSSCGPANPKTCRDLESSHKADNNTQCSEGCFCPPGLIDDGMGHNFDKYIISISSLLWNQLTNDNTSIMPQNQERICLFGFYSISNFLGYLMPNPFLYK